MGYHSGLNGEYNIPVEVNSKHIAHFRRCCKEEVPEKAIKVETYLKDDTIYFVLLPFRITDRYINRRLIYLSITFFIYSI